jgi:outer membrane protein assembly factor BamA
LKNFGLAALLLLAIIPVSADARQAAHESIGRRFTALPLASFSSDDGVGYGLRFSLYDYNGKSVPYAWACSMQAFFTSKGKWVHRITLDFPQLTANQRLTIDFLYDKENFARFSGNLEDSELDTYSEARKTFNQQYPVFTLTWIRTLHLPWKMRAGLYAGHNTITPNAKSGTTLERFSPLGHSGGSFYKAQAAIQYDTRDNYLNATRGLLEEALVEYGLGNGGSFKGGGISYEHRQFLPLQERWVFAYRALGSTLFGNLPFYELPSLGGSRTVRGLPKARLRGKGRMLINSELRWLGFRVSRRMNLNLGGLIFADAGHIFEPADGPSFGSWRAGYGFGLRFYWYSTILRMDYGLSRGNSGLYMRFAHIF